MMMVMVRMKRKKYGFIVNRDTTLPPQIDSGVPLKQTKTKEILKVLPITLGDLEVANVRFESKVGVLVCIDSKIKKSVLKL